MLIAALTMSSKPDILWRLTWNDGEAPEHFSAFDNTRAVGRIYPKETLIGGKEWLWFGADAMATGRCASRREAMLQLEEWYLAHRGEGRE